MIARKKSRRIGIFLLLISVCVPAYSAEVVARFGFNESMPLEAITSVSAEQGAIISAKQYSTAPENIHEGSGSLLISFRTSGKKAGEWRMKLENIPGIKVTGASFWIKSVYGKSDFSVGLADSSGKNLLALVKSSDTAWNRYEMRAGARGEFDSQSVSEFVVLFSSQSPAAHVFFDEVEIYGVKTPAYYKKNPQAAASKTETAGPVSSKPAVKDLDIPLPVSTSAANPAYKGTPPITKLVRPFKRTKEDLKAVSDMLLEAAKNDPPSSKDMTDEEFMDMVQQRAFLFFWYEANPEKGLTLDRGRCFETTGHEVASNASAGFMLTAMGIAHSRGWITYEQAYERVLNTLKFHRDKTKNVEGFFYHFVNIETGERVWNCELSTIDTSLFLAGVVFAMEYFKGTEAAKIAEDIYLRINWRWAHVPNLASTWGGKFCAMGWNPEAGWGNSDAWNRYCEGLLLAVLELGHPKANIDKSAWHDIAKAKGTYKGFECVSQTGPLFGYQYHHCWLDFRNKTDGWGNHFEISVNETLANRQFAIDLMKQRKGYGPDSWGFTACDHPDGYNPFAAPPGPHGENGTVAPTGPGGSFAFTPGLSLKALRYMYDTWRGKIWGKYGFVDAYNIERNWFCGDNIGIDQGPFLLMIENHRTGLVWKTMMNNKYIKTAFKKIGFIGEPRAAAKVLPLDLSGNGWLLFAGDKQEFSRQNYDDAKWMKVFVPDKLENHMLKEFDGTVWYRRHFKVSGADIDSWKSKRLAVHIGGIDDRDEVFLNGTKIGGRSGWDAARVYSFELRLLNPGADNVIAVRVTDLSGDGGIWMRPVEIGPYIQYDWKPFKK